jgi:type IV pilus assembly protein PilX
MNPIRFSAKPQGGFVLVTALMFLVALTVLGVSIMGTNTLEERMSGYFRDRQLAFEAAEAGLREAERDILYGSRAISGVMGFVPGCSTEGLCLPESDSTPVWVDLEAANNSGWMHGEDTSKTVKYGTYSSPPSGPLPLVEKQPRYFIEAMTVVSASDSLTMGRGPKSSSIVYRVTAVGFGRRIATRVVLQALFHP